MAKAWKKIVMQVCWPLMPGWPDEGRRIVQGPHLRALITRAKQQSPQFSRAFNAGAGEGGYSRLLLELPGLKWLVESDFGWRSSLPSRFDPRQLFFCASLASIPAQEANFDLILCTEVLEHIQEHDQALDEMARVLALGGWLLITVPTPPAVPDPNHVREGYRPEELQAMLTARGFEIVDTRFCMHFFFRWLLANWGRMAWCPRILIRSLAFLDRLLPIGPPMDLMILARLTQTECCSTRRAPAPDTRDFISAQQHT
jgi:SAM-dependent methyltransferase